MGRHLCLLLLIIPVFSQSAPINTCFDANHSWSQVKPVINQSGKGRKWVQENWEPSIRCLFEKRIGKIGDGGKHICDPDCLLKSYPNCTVFSIGSNNDFSFEIAIKPYCDHIHTFDHTVNHPTPPNGVIFHKWGVGKYPHKNFKNLLRLTNVKFVHILKVDIEGFEYDFFTRPQIEFMKSTVQQIILEMHINVQPIKKTIQLVNELTDAGFYPFSKEPNIQFSNGECFEISLININKNFR